MKLKLFKSRTRFLAQLVLFTVFYFFGGQLQAQSMDDCSLNNFATDFMNAYMASERLGNADCYKKIIVTMEEALIQQQRVSEMLEANLTRIGYKAGVIDKPTQAILGIEAPIFGTFFEGMFLENGASIDTTSVPSVLFEGDMLARVSDEAINQAKSIEDVAANIDQLIAFVEAPSRMYPAGSRSTGHLLAAMNSIARYGVKGDVITASSDPEFLADLGNMKVTVKDSTGKIIQQGNTADVPHPLLGVLFVRDVLIKRGEHLKVGDLISLGSFTEPEVGQAGMDLTVTYEQLAGQTLTVNLSYK